ncbi:MAG: class I SAM-dependent methyltransferase [Halodesulfurarchaeum sp.]
MHDVPYFDRFAPVYDLLLPGTDPDPLRSGLELADGPIQVVLDLGGGTGRAARALSQNAAVLDGSRPMLEQARTHSLPAIRGDVRSLPLRSDSVDGIVSVDAVHHFPDLPTVVSEVERVLRDGGVFVIRDFDPSTVRGRGLVLGEHVFGFASTFFTPGELTETLRGAGLSPSVLDTGFVYTVVGQKNT